jgi:hypothetical protein
LLDRERLTLLDGLELDQAGERLNEGRQGLARGSR